MTWTDNTNEWTGWVRMMFWRTPQTAPSWEGVKESFPPFSMIGGGKFSHHRGMSFWI